MSYLSSVTKDLLKSRKTRIEVLEERINEASNYVTSNLNKESENMYKSPKKLFDKMKNMIKELKILQQKEKSINDQEIQKAVNSLPERSLIELSLSKIKLNDNYNKAQEYLTLKEESIKNLELELIRQREELEKQKKEDEKNKKLIQNLEQQVVVLRSKSFGYDISKKYYEST